jgi:hypothetical protein
VVNPDNRARRIKLMTIRRECKNIMKFVAEVARQNCFKISQPDWPKYSGAEEKIRFLCKNDPLSLVLSKLYQFFNLFRGKICENSSLIHRGKVKATTLFQILPLFCPFWLNLFLIRPLICPAAHFFTQTLLSYAAEHSAMVGNTEIVNSA